ncbi:MAG TPA: patatin-like phospholipase family protein [Actinomycetota bacterium]|nr:patatin-like phospholipase family protein [Actinomycetota bacterium]
MGSVIYLSQGQSRHRRRSNGNGGSTRGRTALVLGGGGITGAAYHLGVLNAMEAAGGDFSINDFDMYIGTSAGSVIAAFLANGITPAELVRANLYDQQEDLPPIGADEIMLPDRKGLVRSALRWPFGVLGAVRRYLGHPFTTSLIDGLGALAEGLPSALYTTDGTERYIRNVLESRGRSNSFSETDRRLFITATDIDNARRVVFGEDENDAIPISEAAAASTAIPLLYAPRRIGDHEYLDGGLRSTTNLDIAIANGAELIVCINPLVPYVHDVNYLLPTATGLPSRHLAEKGFPHIAAQTFRIMAAAQLEKEVELITETHPNVDIVLVEPRRDDEHLFIFNLMDYASRERVARHAFESVAIDLVTRFPEYRRVLGRHGLKIRRDLLVDQLQAIIEGAEPRFLRGDLAEVGEVADEA